MADQKISAMPNAAALTGAELIPLVQSGANVKSTLSNLKGFGRVYGGFSSTQNQNGSISAGTAMTLNTIDVEDGISVVSNSRITVPENGIYNLQFSAQLKNVDNAQHIATIWIRIGGVDLPNSGTNITVPSRKTASIYGYSVAAWNFFLDLNANEYVELIWLPESTNVTIEALPSNGIHPAIPSLIVTMNQVG